MAMVKDECPSLFDGKYLAVVPRAEKLVFLLTTENHRCISVRRQLQTAKIAMSEEKPHSPRLYIFDDFSIDDFKTPIIFAPKDYLPISERTARTL